MGPADIDAIVALGAPVLCFDTCSVLDIMRDPTRGMIRAHEQAAALALLSAMETGVALVALMAAQVQAEFMENVQSVEEEATKAIKRLRDTFAAVDGIAAIFGANGNSDLSHLDGHAIRSREAAKRWIAAAALVSTNDAIRARAMHRAIGPRTPARQGKESPKDCLVIETYLDIAVKLRTAGFASKIVFVSSNTKDYAGEAGRVLKADLAAEFAGISMEYAPNLAAAKHLLGL